MSSIRQHRRHDRGYTNIPNSIFMNKNLSNKAKGLLCTLLSLPPHWKFTEQGLVTLSKDGRDSVRSALKELETTGYVHREKERVRNEKGQLKGIIYHIYEEPFTPKMDENGKVNYELEEVFNNYYDWMEEV